MNEKPDVPSALSDQPAPPGAEVSPKGMTKLTSATLFAGTQEVLIHHNGEVYRLRETRAGKLILTK